jgi:hypothetical protein
MGDETTATVAQLPVLIKEWLSTEDEVRTLGAAIREKRKRAKLLKDMIHKFMKGGNIGKLNMASGGAIYTRTKETKAPFTKKYIVSTLTEFFQGDATMAAKCAAFLDSHRPVKSTENLTVDTNPPA